MLIFHGPFIHWFACKVCLIDACDGASRAQLLMLQNFQPVWWDARPLEGVGTQNCDRNNSFDIWAIFQTHFWKSIFYYFHSTLCYTMVLYRGPWLYKLLSYRVVWSFFNGVFDCFGHSRKINAYVCYSSFMPRSLRQPQSSVLPVYWVPSMEEVEEQISILTPTKFNVWRGRT